MEELFTFIMFLAVFVFGILSYVFLLQSLEYTKDKKINKTAIFCFVVSVSALFVCIFALHKNIEPTQRSKEIEECIQREDCIIRDVTQKCFLNEDKTIKKCEELK